jgi:hypothetical protein
MKKKLLSIAGICLVIIFLSGCGTKPDEVALQLAAATNTQDLDAALALFTDDAVVTSVSPEPFTGKAEIQGWLEEMFSDNFHLEADVVEVNDNVVIESDTMTMDSMSFYGIEPLTGTSEITVEGGKIKALNFSFSDETLADLQVAPFVAPEDLIGIWSVGTIFQFKEDSTVRVANKMDDLSFPVDEEHPGSTEAWTYDGMVITLDPVLGVGEGYENCEPGQVGVYFVKWSGNDLDRLRFKAIHDPCITRKTGMQWGDWMPISP